MGITPSCSGGTESKVGIGEANLSRPPPDQMNSIVSISAQSKQKSIQEITNMDDLLKLLGESRVVNIGGKLVKLRIDQNGQQQEERIVKSPQKGKSSQNSYDDKNVQKMMQSISCGSRVMIKKKQSGLLSENNFDELDLPVQYSITYKIRKEEFGSQNFANIHFAYLFASPLVTQIGDEIREGMIDEIGYKDEINSIMEGFENENCEIRMRYQLATIQNLMDCLRQRPLGLHFSGHGLQNKLEVFRNPHFYNENKDKGDILVFEEQNGGLAKLVYEKELTQILAQYPTNLEFVVVASCFSERSGMIFKKAGADHVICVDKNNAINDDAAAQFSRTFYTHVFASNVTICQAYELAVHHIQLKFGHAQASILKLLISEGHTCKNLSYSATDFFTKGTLLNLSPCPAILILPSDDKNWVPRHMELYDVIQKLLQGQNRVVEVFGFSGVGKSTIIKKAAHFLADRNTYPGGIIYANLAGIKTVTEAFQLVIHKIYIEMRISPVELLKLKNNSIEFLNLKFGEIFRQSQRKLLILDNLDDLILYQTAETTKLINLLIRERDNLQILFSSSVYIDSLDQLAVKNLKGLTQKKSLDLFLQRLPSEEETKKVFTRVHIEELHKFTCEKDQTFAKSNTRLCNHPCRISSHKQGVEQCISLYLSKHPLFKIVNQPLSICLVACLMRKLSLTEIYKMLISNELFKDQGDALLLSIEQTVLMFQKQDKRIVDIFYLIGITEVGLTYEEIHEIFYNVSEGHEQIEFALQKLQEASLIIYDKESQSYKIENLLKKYAEQKVRYSKKLSLLVKLVKYYIMKISKFKSSLDFGIMDTNEVIDNFQKKEKNILQCASMILEMLKGSNIFERQRNSNYNTLHPMNYRQFGDMYKRRRSTNKRLVNPQAENLKQASQIQPKQSQKRNKKSIAFTDHGGYLTSNQNNQALLNATYQNSITSPSSVFQGPAESIISEFDLEEFKDEEQKVHTILPTPIDMKKKQSSLYFEEVKSQEGMNSQVKSITSSYVQEPPSQQSSSQNLERRKTNAFINNDEVEEWEKSRYRNAVIKIGQLEYSEEPIDQDGWIELKVQKFRQNSGIKVYNAIKVDFQKRLTACGGNQESVHLEDISSVVSFHNISRLSQVTEENNDTIMGGRSALVRNQTINEEENEDSDDSDMISDDELKFNIEQDIESLLESMLYSYFVIIALKKDSINEFLEQSQLFLENIDDHQFVGKINLLLVYLFIVNKQYDSALNELVSLEQLFLRNECKQGLAIVYYFQGYCLILSKQTQQSQINKYLKQSYELFKQLKDTEGQNFSKALIKGQNLQLLKNSRSLGSGNEEQNFNNTIKVQESTFRRMILDKEKMHLNLLLNDFILFKK